MRFAWVIALLIGCGGGGDATLVISTSFTISESSGMGPSHLDVLNGQTVAIDVVFDSAIKGSAIVGGCPATEWTQVKATTSASGASAAMVKTEILDYLPDWSARLSLCDVVAQSSLQLASDNQMNTGFTIGCIGLPMSAVKKDGSGNPVWTSFTAPSCTFTILDAGSNRVLGACDFTTRAEI